jgi:hypothetical protein
LIFVLFKATLSKQKLQARNDAEDDCEWRAGEELEISRHGLVQTNIRAFAWKC